MFAEFLGRHLLRLFHPGVALFPIRLVDQGADHLEAVETDVLDGGFVHIHLFHEGVENLDQLAGEGAAHLVFRLHEVAEAFVAFVAEQLGALDLGEELPQADEAVFEGVFEVGDGAELFFRRHRFGEVAAFFH